MLEMALTHSKTRQDLSDVMSAKPVKNLMGFSSVSEQKTGESSQQNLCFKSGDF